MPHSAKKTNIYFKGIQLVKVVKNINAVIYY